MQYFRISGIMEIERQENNKYKEQRTMKGKHLFLLALLAVPIFWSCSDDEEGSTPTVEKLNIELNDQQRSIRDMGNDFANNLLIHASEKDENVLLSPLSLQFVLGMIANGADEEAYAELVNTLGLSGYSLDELNKYHQTMITGLTANKVEGADFSLGNAVWIQDGVSVDDLFIANMNEYYAAPVNYLDFSQTKDAQKKINNWAYKATHSTIKDLQLPLDESTKLVLNNACYFSGKWTSPFNEKRTEVRFFTCEGGDVVSAQFMQKTGKTYYLQTDGYQQAELFFNGGFTMSIVLPEEGRELEDILPAVNWLSPQSLQYVEVDLKLPKFDMELNQNLNSVLQEMGIKKIYSSGGLPNLADNLAVSLIQQNTNFSIDEGGVKAATTTSGTMNPSANISPAVLFDLNRPFAFAIYENSSKTLLFIGKVANLK